MRTRIRTSLKLMLLSYCCPLFVSAGGVSVVGNGAGIVEQDFQYAYLLVDQFAKNCLQVSDCQLSDEERALLSEIRIVYRFNFFNQNRLVFISEKELPGFFDTGEGQAHRIAKTGTSAEDAIYINTDMLYRNGQPALDVASMFAILIHEMGHQAGETNHQKLDILATKLKAQLNEQVQKYKASFPNGTAVNITITHKVSGLEISDIHINGASDANYEIKMELKKHQTCGIEGESLLGFEYENAAFFEPRYGTGKNRVIGFSFWMQVKCFNPENGETYLSRREVNFVITDELELDLILVRRHDFIEPKN